MQPQNYEKKNNHIKEMFKKKLAEKPSLKEAEIKFSWSNWSFGMEALEKGQQRIDPEVMKNGKKLLADWPKKVLAAPDNHSLADIAKEEMLKILSRITPHQ